ncbi:(2Fe-2S)-binding protein [Rhizomonospora bruguierae]|uniref:(2Fe-2S)-binding protein n=1 Tax=Rhizomonospora bruguierae TaxID=1581705 RepID=UPI0020BEBFAC|nr:(2Fe-2S)-binding protein [Micromonospora sp. NBRC 107566]
MDSEISLRVNGAPERVAVPDRMTLADALRDRLGRTGTKLGCEQGVCGACTVLVDGATARSCLVLAGQAAGADVVTVEGLADASPAGRALQAAFARNDALQCGFCTPGFLVAALELLAEEQLDEARVRDGLSGNLCRCTGYGGIVRAVLEVHERLGPVPLPDIAGARSPLAVSEQASPVAGVVSRSAANRVRTGAGQEQTEPPDTGRPSTDAGRRPTDPGRALARSGAAVAAVVACYVAWRWWRSRRRLRDVPLHPPHVLWVCVPTVPPAQSSIERRR